MLSVAEALARVMVEVEHMPAEDVPLAESYGRILAEDAVSPVNVPPWDASAMDGYAVRAADATLGARLRVLETLGAGRAATRPVGPGEAMPIMTGAPVPDGADAVVIVEDTDGAREGLVRIDEAAVPGQHVRRRGEDVRVGTRVLAAGERLTPARVGVLASLGQARVRVRRRPVVALLTTGDELVPPGLPLGPGQIYSSNNATLAGLVLEAGGVPVDHGLAPDDLEALCERLGACLEADLVLTTGGVSVGVYDHVREALVRLGVTMDFWKIRMKPGKPLAFGHAESGGRKVPVFGLPGNPVSCMVCFHEYVRPRMRAMLGQERPYLPVVRATCLDDLRARPGRARFERVRLEATEGGWVCRGTGNSSSGVLGSMARAHGLLLVDADAAGPAAGEEVDVQLLDADFLDRELPGVPR